MTYGIIYRAYNKISKKSYVGQTSRPLLARIKQHYKTCKNYNHKFANALKHYNSEDWEWTILKEVLLEELDEYESYYIQDLDTFNNGYNSTEDGRGYYTSNTRVYNSMSSISRGTIYNLYHPEKGFLSGRRQELLKVEPSLKHIYDLISGEKKSIKGWVLSENRDLVKAPSDYRNGGVHEFKHPEKGTFKGRASEFYNQCFNTTRTSSGQIKRLIRGSSRECEGWILVKKGRCPYRHNGVQKESISLKLIHDIHGILELTALEFVEKYKLTEDGIRLLLKGERKKHRGWSLVIVEKGNAPKTKN